MKKNIFILTMFPEIFTSFIETGVIGKALRQERSDYQISLIPLLLSDFSDKGFKGVDSSTYGGGPGMVIRADILKKAYEYVLSQSDKIKTIYLSPHGELWNRNLAKDMADQFTMDTDLLFICGRYEGIDQRFIDLYVDQIISVGDFVLSCGDWALTSIIDSMLRFVPGVIGDAKSVSGDSFEDGLLDYPHYTKPAIFEGHEVPKVLTSGNHKKINEWRQSQKIKLTKSLRPDLYRKYHE